jgi:hypothetical protein
MLVAGRRGVEVINSGALSAINRKMKNFVHGLSYLFSVVFASRA